MRKQLTERVFHLSWALTLRCWKKKNTSWMMSRLDLLCQLQSAFQPLALPAAGRPSRKSIAWALREGSWRCIQARNLGLGNRTCPVLKNKNDIIITWTDLTSILAFYTQPIKKKWNESHVQKSIIEAVNCKRFVVYRKQHVSSTL